MKCPKCNGEGEINIKAKDKLIYITFYLVCNRCNGSGKLDWIDNIIPSIYSVKINSILVK
jgi:DnaJ-class molecular chaperone